MSHYIRLSTNYFTHRKTVRLRAKLGDAAYWLMPRLWAYAAEHQPDGCFKDYSAEEIAMLIGFNGDAQAMLQAMLQACYMDKEPLRLHDWEEHNNYHSAFADRAKKAAAARWGKPNSPSPIPPTPTEDKKGKDKKGKETSNASSMLQASNRPKERRYVIPPERNWIIEYGRKLKWADAASAHFFDYYEGVGWMRNKTKMKDWEATMRTWNNKTNGKPASLELQIKCLEEEIMKHPANPESLSRAKNPTKEQTAELQAMRDRLREIKRKVANQ